MTVPLSLLLLEDDADDAELLVAHVRRAGFDPTWTRVHSREAYLAALGSGEYDILLADYSLPGFDAITALDLLAANKPDLPAIVVSGAMNEETCVQSLRHGAVDYLLKDRLARLGPAIRHALEQRRLGAERRAAEQALQDSEVTLRSVLDAAPAMAYLTDDEGRFLLVNAEFQRMFRVDGDQVRGRTPADLGLPELANRDGRCRRRGTVVEADEVFGQGDAAQAYLSTRYPMRRPDGTVYAVVAMYTDITRQKRVEAALRLARGELQRQADQLVHANAELHELDQLKSQFIANVSHELRTPLSSILGYTELLNEPDSGLPGSLRRIITTIDRNGRRLLGLIDDLLTFSQAEGGAMVIAPEVVDVAELVQRCRAAVAPAAAAAGLTLAVELVGDLPAVPGDPTQLDRVLLNLLSNAVKFSQPGGRVTISAVPGPQGVRLSVADTGMGIPTAEQPKLFTKFFRSSTAERHAIQGTGLGLVLAKSIVDAHGGRISAVSEPDVGTTIIVDLPALDTTAVPAA